jgi:hypothetical protein
VRCRQPESVEIPHENLVGRRFGRLTVLEQSESRAYRRRWKCACDCGAEADVATDTLKRGKTKSCGCLSRDMADTRRALVTAAGKGTKPPEFWSWRALVTSGTVPVDGVTVAVDPAWLDYDTFAADVGKRPEGASLERIDDSLPFGKANSRWRTS